MKALEIINFGANELKKNNIISSRLDSELLLSNILNKKREEILTNLNQEIDAINLEKYKKLYVSLKDKDFSENVKNSVHTGFATKNKLNQDI